MSAFEVVDGSQLHVSSSSDDEELQPPQPLRPNHGRSLSHPFPLLFSNKKKPVRPRAESSSSDSTDETAQMTNSKRRPQPPRTHRSGQSSGSKDFATGHCMTCGSLVRWPRELRVFRCTICLTINDLQPLSSEEKRVQTGNDKATADDTGVLAQQSPRHSKSPHGTQP
jgi:E3 ubiquitin-protein ligase HECTD2